jgi:adenosylhomocysteine nucleosidase
MLLFVAADPMEFAGLRRHCASVAPLPVPVDWARSADLHGNRIVMIANGAGARRAAKAVDAVSEITAIVSTGFCGALDPALGIGDIFVAASIRGVSVTPPRCSTPHTTGALASIDHVAQTAAEKRKLHAAGASAVEMEAAGVQERARALGVPFYCVRSITDLAGETFANDLNSALREDGHFDTMQILRAAMRNPGARLRELVRLRQRCKVAARTLGDFLADCRF